MANINGLSGLRPTSAAARDLTTPPYDVIKEGSPLEALLDKIPSSFFHVTLGPTPAETLTELQKQGILIQDAEPCFYVY